MKKAFLCIFCFISFLYGKEVVLITGASQGIGLHTAERLAREGYMVYGTYRETSDLEGLNTALTRCRGHLFKVLMDVRDESSVKSAVDNIIEKEGKIDFLINNAGILLYGSWEGTSIEQAQHVFDVNYFGPMRLIQAVLPEMRKQKKGHIINITSRAAFRPIPSLSVYASSKAALMSASESLAASLEPWNIKISCIEPGPVQTAMDANALEGSRFTKWDDPYRVLFEAAGLTLKNSMATAQPVEEVVDVIIHALQSHHPLLRYQTSQLVKQQAALRARDVTGLSGLKELKKGFKNK